MSSAASACGNHSGLIVKTIPGYRENPFAFTPESLCTISPESFSSSPRNTFHVRPGIPFTLPRIPQVILRRLAVFRLPRLDYAYEPDGQNASDMCGFVHQNHHVDRISIVGPAQRGRNQNRKES
jgi:hypothetical protein